ncbi:hypothetical protein DICPUDRAFT_76336 [Dictyostelium purpureum]|uniref:EGF-like domain-containing protein n=1 Tax=Dictyostelium purpureum TaxID=5786 RepID=F0ZDB1_DICPU|nr:uncharacterized protein DICPUDRAFT_76336 [Dictyostelium purpureum]EGC38078.1 hypothetical protein DICPUDRAFT_76336 [Dictyostelium purpureum]|eukprot:XP_003285385.1 hypothetical protein DICPUDRAFT_76336 [Dictyostelium purpureum]
MNNKNFLIILILLVINLNFNSTSIITNYNSPNEFNYDGSDILNIDGYFLPRYLNGQLFTNFQLQFTNGTIYNFDKIQVDFYQSNNSYHYTLNTPRGFGNGIFKVFTVNETTEMVIGKYDFSYQAPQVINASLVSPRFGGSVTLNGNGFFETLININVLNKTYPCSNIVSNDQGTQLTCEMGQVLNVIDADYYELELISGNMLNTTFEKFSFLPWGKVCPNQCSGNGQCDSQLNCICNEGYEAFDCSIKVDLNQMYPQSNLTESTTFKMKSPFVSGNVNVDSKNSSIDTNNYEEFSISISSFRRLNLYGYAVNQYPFSVLSNVQQMFTNDSFTVSGTAPIKTDLFESFEFDGNFYLNSDESPENFISEHGFEVTLPTSRNSAIINLLTTGITSNDYDTDSFQFVFSISLNNGSGSNNNQKLNATMGLNQVISITSDTANSVLEITPYYYSFSLSKDVNKEIDRAPIKASILSDEDASSIFGYNPNSIYIALESKIQYDMLMLSSSFNLYKNIDIPNNSSDNDNHNNHSVLLKVFLPIGTFIVISIIGISVFIIKRRNNNKNNNNGYKTLLNNNNSLNDSDDEYFKEENIQNI